MSAAQPARRILFYSPYGQWHYHGVVEISIGHALRQRGAEVGFVACDAQFPACDVYREDINPRDGRSCLQCQASTAGLYNDMGMPYAWLGRYVPAALRPQIRDWAASLAPEALLKARWRDRPVGDWARSSAFYQFRMSRFELDDPKVVRGVRDHVAGTALAVEALGALYDDWRPEVVVLLNGRFFSHWAAFELARERGIRVATHERGLLKGSLRFLDGARVHELGVYRELWKRWGDVPLEHAELMWIHAVLADRRLGHNLPGQRFSPLPQDESELRRRLDLDERPVVALFSSSDDESAVFEERRRGAFPDSFEFLRASLELARALPDHVVVIRLHPNLTGNGVNRQTLAAVAELLPKLPENVRVVMPDDEVSSYTLADLARAGVVYFSTLGLEMASRGQPVVAVAQGWYGQCDFVRRVERPGDYVAAVRAALAEGPRLATARRAHRFAYHVYRELSIPFPLVVEEPSHHGRPRYQNAAQLQPGVEPNLDRICDFLLDGTPLLRSPDAAHRARSAADEDRFFSSLHPGLAP